MIKIAATVLAALPVFSTIAVAQISQNNPRVTNEYVLHNYTLRPLVAMITNQGKQGTVPGRKANSRESEYISLYTNVFDYPSYLYTSKAYYGLRVAEESGKIICETVVTARVDALANMTCGYDSPPTSSDCELSISTKSDGGNDACYYVIKVD